MKLRQTTLGLALAAGLVLGSSGCNSDDQAAPPASDIPSATPTPATPPMPTADPTTLAKDKALADYEAYAAFRSRGLLSNDPAYPYEQAMTGNALQAAKSVTTGMNLSGRKFTGSYKYLSGSVVALDLKAKPATATVKACVDDAVVLRDKTGKVLTSPPAKVSTNDKLVLVGAKWKVTETATLPASAAGCA